MTIYPDTGALVSFFGADAGTATAVAAVRREMRFLLTPLLEIEFLNALQLRVFRREWSGQQASAVAQKFRAEIAAGIFAHAEMDGDVWRWAQRLSQRHTAEVGVRALDLLHVAAAVRHRAEAFLSFDRRQRRLAVSMKLRLLPR